MVSRIDAFERIVRRAQNHTEDSFRSSSAVHPFDERNIHADLPAEVRRLFDDGHFSQASFEAMKFLDEEVDRKSVV